MIAAQLRTLDDLSAVAADLSAHLVANGFSNPPGPIYAMTLAEEVGELVGAVRRWLGLARRAGTFDDVGAELVDVLITAFVADHDLRLNIGSAFNLSLLSHVTVSGDPMTLTLELDRKAGAFTGAVLDDAPYLAACLADAVEAALLAGAALGVDVMAAVNRKLAIIYGLRVKSRRAPDPAPVTTPQAPTDDIIGGGLQA